MILRRGATHEAWISSAAGAVRLRITLPPGALRLAARRGVLLVQTDARTCTAIDLRLGRSRSTDNSGEFSKIRCHCDGAKKGCPKPAR